MRSISVDKIYDAIPYGDETFPNTHPEYLAAVATLFGLTPTNPRTSRVLELGCAKGENLIGMAYSLPECTFVGIDLSNNQVSEGNSKIRNYGLDNIELLHKNILDLDQSLGKFDYIIAHGVLSWVPKEIALKMFEICNLLLTDNGIAYFSYNTYPGWKSRDIFRDMMFFEAENFDSPQELASRSKFSVAVMNNLLKDNKSELSNHLKHDLAYYLDRPEWYYLHDFVAENNNPYYISEIIDFAKINNLQYVCDTELSTCTTSALSPNTQKQLNVFKDNRRKFEQYLDIATLRSFRRSIFSRIEKKVSYDFRASILENLFISANLDYKAPSGEQTNHYFSHTNGGAISFISLEAANALKKVISAWPNAIKISELIQDSSKRPTLESLLGGIFANLISLRVNPTNVINIVSEKPLASLLARKQAESSNVVTGLNHQQITLGEIERKILVKLDGTNSKSEIAKSIYSNIQITEQHLIQIEQTIYRFMKSSLLEG